MQQSAHFSQVSHGADGDGFASSEGVGFAIRGEGYGLGLSHSSDQCLDMGYPRLEQPTRALCEGWYL